MFATPVAHWFGRRGIHFSWIVMGIAFLTMLTSSAALGLPGAFLLPLSKEFGWSTDEISGAIALRFALYGLIGPFAAVLMERYGLRRIICSALLLIAVGMVLATRMTALWQLVVLWGVVLGVGSGLTALVLGATVANRWFEQRRGLVMGMLTASSATGQLIFLPIAASLIQNHGWRMAVIPRSACCATGRRSSDCARSAPIRRTSSRPPAPGGRASPSRSARCSWPRAAARSGCCSARSSSAAFPPAD